jgi:hypothetical protein
VIFGILDRLVRRVLRRSFRLGVLEGSVVWLAAGAAALVFRLMFKPESPHVHRERLAVGETLVVTHRPAPESTRRKKPIAGS